VLVVIGVGGFYWCWWLLVLVVIGVGGLVIDGYINGDGYIAGPPQWASPRDPLVPHGRPALFGGVVGISGQLGGHQ